MSSKFTDDAYFSGRPYLEYVFILCACFGQLITMAVTTNVLTHMNLLQEDFNSSSSFKPWYMASFGLSVGTIILVSGRYGDVYGIRRVLVGGYIWNIIWSILCGIAWYTQHLGPDFYVVARTFQGVGVAFILPNVLGAVGRVYKNGLRKKIVFGLIGSAAPAGSWVGLTMSGVIAVRTERWDWNYYAYAMFIAVAGVLTYLSVPDLPLILNDDGSRQDLDLIGSALGVSGMVLFNFAWNQAPIVGWQEGYIIALLVVGVFLLCLFVYWELKWAKNPLVPRMVLQHSRLPLILLCVFLGWGAYSINIYHCYTLYLDFRGYTPFAAGAGLTPAPFFGLCAGIACALLISPKTVEYLFLGAMLGFLAQTIIITTAEVDESYFRNTMAMWMVGPIGMNWTFPAATIMLSEFLPPRSQGMAGSLVSVMMNYGISIFLGFAGTVEEELHKQRPDDSWRAWRGAEYFSCGVAGLGFIISIILLLTKPRSIPTSSPPPDPEQDLAKKPAQNHDHAHRDIYAAGSHDDSDSISALSVDV